jgi:lipopolysaccharide transport system ATP-binding protein
MRYSHWIMVTFVNDAIQSEHRCMKPSVEVAHIWKTYRLSGKRGYKSLRESLQNKVQQLFSRNASASVTSGSFHALKDVSFSVAQGNSLGIVGRNGAGKSTILKILAGVTPPTKGQAVIRGNAGSLLEVGTGFHPELSGRENIFFNGSLLGMKTREINRSLDEIIAFAGIGTYVDEPLKHYSSGMQMRLAFSVAAHLRTDIIIIDEVLSVGDAGFQKKCLGKMEELGREEGKTAIIVSHDMALLSQLCNQGLLLDQGIVTHLGTMEECSQKYRAILQESTQPDTMARAGNGAIRVTNVRVYRPGSEGNIVALQEMVIHIVYAIQEQSKMAQSRIDIGINNESGQRVAWLSSVVNGQTLEAGKEEIVFHLPSIPLKPGQYDLNIYIEVNYSLADWLRNVYPFTISYGDVFHPYERTPPGQGDLLLTYTVNQP